MLDAAYPEPLTDVHRNAVFCGPLDKIVPLTDALLIPGPLIAQMLLTPHGRR